MSTHRGTGLVIRADASAEMGTGHVMRCMALGEAWRRSGGPVWLLSHSLPSRLATLLARRGIRLTPLTAVAGSYDDACATADFAKAHSAAWIVCDGYHFDSAYQQTVTEQGLRLLAVDDYGSLDGYPCGHVLNQNLSARPEWYTPGTKCLLGPRYALLRSEFTRASRRAPLVRRLATRVLITMGGADPANTAGAALAALDQMAAVEIRILVGAANRHAELLRRAAAQSNHAVRLIRGCRRVDRQFRWADVALTAAGSTVWEIAAMGTPMLVVPIVDNQLAIADALNERWPGMRLDPSSCDEWPPRLEALMRDWSMRRRLAAELKQMVDGRGACRVVHELGAIAASDRARVR